MPQLPRFFFNGALTENTTVSLDADTAKHIWQVLRMDAGDRIQLTDGNGTLAEGSIYTAERHKCNVNIEKAVVHARAGGSLHLCVGFTKNNSRNEWLLEKATELGVTSIVPVAAARSERTHMRHDRWHKILQSAILQSQQHYLPYLADVTSFEKVVSLYKDKTHKLIAHCMSETDRNPLSKMLNPSADTVLLIGPEGDFTQDEVNLAIRHGFQPVSLGNQRLRTETAAIAAAAFFNVMNDGQK
jgi:16S rRNA (uracil1498-N3)-methyltransferase